MSYIPYIDPDHYGNFFQIDDVSTPIDPAAEHFVISGYGTYGAPERDVEAVAVPGRNGDLIFDNGRFTNAEVYYDIGWARGFGGDFSYAVSETNLIEGSMLVPPPVTIEGGQHGIYGTRSSANGTIILDGTATDTYDCAVLIERVDVSRGSYYFTIGGTGAANMRIYFAYWSSVLDVDSGSFDVLNIVSGERGKYINVPTAGSLSVIYRVYEGAVLDDFTMKPQLFAATVKADPYTGFDYFRGRLMSKSDTYYKLTDSYHPGEYRMARVARIEEISTTALNDGGRCRVVFDCKPQRFLESGEEAITLTNGTAAAVVLNTYYPSYPVIEVTPASGSRIKSITVQTSHAEGSDTVTNSVTVTCSGTYFPSGEGSVIIDCEARAAEFSNTPPAITLSTTDFPYLAAGVSNSVTVTLTAQSGQSNVLATIALKTKEYVV